MPAVLEITESSVVLEVSETSTVLEIVSGGVTLESSSTPGPLGPAGDGGVVDTIVAGTNITVDDTDPENPIVSSTATGVVPVQVVTVTEDRDLLASDVGNMLISDGDPWNITTVDVGQDVGDFFYTVGLNIDGEQFSPHLGLWIAQPGSWYHVGVPYPSILIDSAGATGVSVSVGGVTISYPLTSALDLGANDITNALTVTAGTLTSTGDVHAGVDVEADGNVSAGGDVTTGENSGDGTNGVLLYSPDGSQFRVTVDDAGTLVTAEV